MYVRTSTISQNTKSWSSYKSTSNTKLKFPTINNKLLSSFCDLGEKSRLPASEIRQKTGHQRQQDTISPINKPKSWKSNRQLITVFPRQPHTNPIFLHSECSRTRNVCLNDIRVGNPPPPSSVQRDAALLVFRVTHKT